MPHTENSSPEEKTPLDIASNPLPAKKGFLAPSMLGALALFLVFWVSDFPKPSYDDLFYLGAGLNLAQRADLSNPLLARQEFPSHFFFVYPPIHAYAMAGWLKIFGISARSVTAFPIAMCLVTALATIALLRRYGAPCWLEWLVPFGVAIALLPSGLRTEPLAIALIMAGFAVLEYAQGRAPCLFLGFFLLFLGALAAPRIAPLAAALGGFSCYQIWKESRAAGRTRWDFWLIAFASLALVGLIFLVMIHFRVGEFLATFHYHASGRVREGKVEMLSHFIKTQRITVWPIWAIFFGLILMTVRKPMTPLGIIGLLAAGAFLVEGVVADLVPHTLWYMIFGFFALAASFLKTGPPLASRLLSCALVLALFLANLKAIVDVVGIQTGRISADLGPERDKALALHPSAQHPLLVDYSIARYLYGYRLPPGSLDLGFSNPFPASFVSSGPLRPGDIYLLHLSTLRGLERDTNIPHPPEEFWNPLRLSLLEFDRYPCRVYIVTAEECNGLRPDKSSGPP